MSGSIPQSWRILWKFLRVQIRIILYKERPAGIFLHGQNQVNRSNSLWVQTDKQTDKNVLPSNSTPGGRVVNKGWCQFVTTHHRIMLQSHDTVRDDLTLNATWNDNTWHFSYISPLTPHTKHWITMEIISHVIVLLCYKMACRALHQNYTIHDQSTLVVK